VSLDRVKELRRHIGPDARGIEIGPYHNAITPRKEGFRSVYLDLFDANDLRARAAEDPLLSDKDVANIETVDLIGSANDIGELVTARFGDEKFDYVVSSHNIEHLPNPIKFLQGCQQILKPGGVISFAIPDHRYCFDFYRSRTQVSEWLDAHLEDRKAPTRGQLFQWVASASNVDGNPTWDSSSTSFPVPWALLESARQYWDGTVTMEYLDAHCWVFTPSSFRLIIEDLRALGFHEFDVESVSQTQGCEFFVHLRHAPGTESFPVAEAGGEPYADRRSRTMRAMIIEDAEVARQFASAPPVDPPADEAPVSPPPQPVRPRWPRLRAFLAARRP
jgi:SAM-dependent methyltransferase